MILLVNKLDIEQQMKDIKNKESPTTVDIYKYVRYLINIKKYPDDDVYQDVLNWDKEKVSSAIKEVKRENLKPKPKRYYVSLKEPLEENY